MVTSSAHHIMLVLSAYICFIRQNIFIIYHIVRYQSFTVYWFYEILFLQVGN